MGGVVAPQSFSGDPIVLLGNGIAIGEPIQAETLWLDGESIDSGVSFSFSRGVLLCRATLSDPTRIGAR